MQSSCILYDALYIPCDMLVNALDECTIRAPGLVDKVQRLQARAARVTSMLMLLCMLVGGSVLHQVFLW